MPHIFSKALLAAALVITPAAAMAQTKSTTPTQPGASANAPGQRAQETGKSANTFAPGQQEKVKDKDKQPGAKEYAPGQMPKKN